MKTHPAAEIFPLLEGSDFEALVTDIREHKLREAIWRDKSGRILDGRNRLRACKEAGVKPRFRTYEGDDVVSFVISLNLHRRHLTESQRAMAGARLANLGEGRPSKTASIEAVSQKAAAGLVNVSRASVQRAARVLDECNEQLVSAVDRGLVKVTDAAAVSREPHPMQLSLLGRVTAGKVSSLQAAVREQDLAQRIEEIEDGEWTASDQYDVIVFDPSWEHVKPPYETKFINEVEGLHINHYAASNCVLWLWATHVHILFAFHLLRRWGFNYTLILTWVKDSHGQRPKKTEFCIMATYGSPKFNSTIPPTVIEAPARQKNQKPDEFYEMVDSFCVGKKLDYFARKKRDGWEQFGNDCDRFEGEA